MAVDGPHSRACGPTIHQHGLACHPNCPTCHGQRGQDRPLEDECEDTIVAAATMLGYRVHAARRARSKESWRTPIKGHVGFPDLVIAGHGTLIVRELKRRPNKVEPEQQAWLDTLRIAGIDAHVLWVPEEQDGFIRLLQDIAENARAARR